jgi:hypothetical protein
VREAELAVQSCQPEWLELSRSRVRLGARVLILILQIEWSSVRLWDEARGGVDYTFGCGTYARPSDTGTYPRGRFQRARGPVPFESTSGAGACMSFSSWPRKLFKLVCTLAHTLAETNGVPFESTSGAGACMSFQVGPDFPTARTCHWHATSICYACQ